MTVTIKRWSRLGLGAALAGGALLTACDAATAPQTPGNQVASDKTDAGAPSQVSGAGEMGEGAGEAGEGEGGEGGVDVSLAATDAVVFRSALAITRAHVIAARDAFAAGETEAAAEMFAHPVSEVLFEMEPVLAARGVEGFDDLLTGASVAVFEGESVDAINDRVREIFAAIDRAAEKAPDDGRSPARIAAGVVSDQISRAVDLYRGAMQSEAYEPYLDGYGYYLTANTLYQREKSAIRREYGEAASEIETALDALKVAFPGALRPETLSGDAAALAVADSRIVLALSQ